ncbi:hypothetical protein [Bacillus thuringiensis]|uniref:hypothetical protein n=1 Tax=Bacillus thuringiensis TaxID=1428 RepID=UPI0011454004|nr:hypothetical protein [Bacillus thuringiensis]
MIKLEAFNILSLASKSGQTAVTRLIQNGSGSLHFKGFVVASSPMQLQLGDRTNISIMQIL